MTKHKQKVEAVAKSARPSFWRITGKDLFFGILLPGSRSIASAVKRMGIYFAFYLGVQPATTLLMPSAPRALAGNGFSEKDINTLTGGQDVIVRGQNNWLAQAHALFEKRSPVYKIAFNYIWGSKDIWLEKGVEAYAEDFTAFGADKCMITIKPNLQYQEQNYLHFVIAHELAHCRTIKNFTAVPVEEARADAAAYDYIAKRSGEMAMLNLRFARSQGIIGNPTHDTILYNHLVATGQKPNIQKVIIANLDAAIFVSKHGWGKALSGKDGYFALSASCQKMVIKPANCALTRIYNGKGGKLSELAQLRLNLTARDDMRAREIMDRHRSGTRIAKARATPAS